MLPFFDKLLEAELLAQSDCDLSVKQTSVEARKYLNWQGMSALA